MTRLIACVWATMLLAGCGVPQMFQIEVPTTRVNGASVTATSDEGTQVTVFVQVRNPNMAALPLLGAHYTFNVDGRVVTYADEVHRTLPSAGIQIVALPVAMPSDGAELGGRRFDISGSITYKPPGQLRKLLSESRIPLPTIAFAGSGTIE